MMIFNTLAQIIVYFFLYSVIGWVCEVIYSSILDRKLENRGFLFGPYCPIYGFGALIFVNLLLPWSPHPVLLFIVGTLACTLLEYVTSWAMEKLFNLRWWDYSSYHFNLNGRICLRNSLLFGVMGLFLVYLIHPLCLRLMGHFPGSYIHIVAVIILIVMLIDLIFSALALLDLAKKLHQFEQQIDEMTVQLTQHWHKELNIKSDFMKLLSDKNKMHLTDEAARLMMLLKSSHFKQKHLNKLLAISRMNDLNRQHSPLMIIHRFLQAKIALKQQKHPDVDQMKKVTQAEDSK